MKSIAILPFLAVAIFVTPAVAQLFPKPACNGGWRDAANYAKNASIPAERKVDAIRRAASYLCEPLETADVIASAYSSGERDVLFLYLTNGPCPQLGPEWRAMFLEGLVKRPGGGSLDLDYVRQNGCALMELEGVQFVLELHGYEGVVESPWSRFTPLFYSPRQ